MKLIISFSGRTNGNCDQIASFVAEKSDSVVLFRELQTHPCSHCEYECFDGECRYRADDIYALYESMQHYDKVVLIVPIYCSNPSSLYFIFNERSQDYFMHNDMYDGILQKLYIIGVYGSNETSPDFIPCLEKWFYGSPYTKRVLSVQRHLYGQKLHDCILDIEEVKAQIGFFLNN